MKKLDIQPKKKFRIVKTIKKVKKYSFDDGLIFLGTCVQS